METCYGRGRNDVHLNYHHKVSKMSTCLQVLHAPLRYAAVLHAAATERTATRGREPGKKEGMNYVS
jgi:hypothetical protein